MPDVDPHREADGAPSSARRRQVQDLLAAVGAWAEARDDVRAAALVGSWARGAPHASSDVDVVVLTTAVAPYVADEGWIAALGATAVLRTRRWGPLVERRLALAGGLELEVGLAEPTWAATDPLDAGTAGVVADGLVPLHDPDGLLAALVAAVAAARQSPR